MTGRRIAGLDAARGIAMLLVCLSHFCDVHFVRNVVLDGWFGVGLVLIGKVATPTFVLVSGILMGCQTEAAACSPRFRLHLLDRALFLVTIGHLLIALSFTPRWGVWKALTSVYITDTVALCVVVGLYAVPHISRNVRFVLGGLCALGNWFVWRLWATQDPLLLPIKSVLLGPPEGSDTILIFPILPWVGWYLVGSAIGEWINGDGSGHVSRKIWRLGAAGFGMLALALGLKAGVMLHASVTGVMFDPRWYAFISPFQKYPPGPGYLLAMGGAALVLVSVLLSPAQPPWIKKCAMLAEPIGRNSLVIFIVQFYLYFAACDLFVKQGMVVPLAISVAAFLLSLVGLWAVAQLCHRYRISRFLTTGLPALLPSMNESRVFGGLRRAA
jgi:uncharacterized membrane protein